MKSLKTGGESRTDGILSSPQTQRKKGGIAFRLTDRDAAIIKAVNAFRYMRTGQINRLVFSENTSPQSCQKRLKLLYHNKYLDRVPPFLQQGNQDQNADMAYRLDFMGARYLDDFGIPVLYSRKKTRVKHNFLLHALDLSEFRLNLELALAQSENLAMRKFIPDFLQKEGQPNLMGLNRYRLYDEISDPATGQKAIFYPDALVVLENTKAESKRLFFVEIDRGTEGLETIRRKIAAYHLYATYNQQSKFGPYAKFVVLFQTNSPRRAENMVRLINEMQCQPTVLVTDHKEVTPKTILKGEIWRTVQGKIISLIR